MNSFRCSAVSHFFLCEIWIGLSHLPYLYDRVTTGGATYWIEIVLFSARQRNCTLTKYDLLLAICVTITIRANHFTFDFLCFAKCAKYHCQFKHIWSEKWFQSILLLLVHCCMMKTVDQQKYDGPSMCRDSHTLLSQKCFFFFSERELVAGCFAHQRNQNAPFSVTSSANCRTFHHITGTYISIKYD